MTKNPNLMKPENFKTKQLSKNNLTICGTFSESNTKLITCCLKISASQQSNTKNSSQIIHTMTPVIGTI